MIYFPKAIAQIFDKITFNKYIYLDNTVEIIVYKVIYHRNFLFHLTFLQAHYFSDTVGQRYVAELTFCQQVFLHTLLVLLLVIPSRGFKASKSITAIHELGIHCQMDFQKCGLHFNSNGQCYLIFASTLSQYFTSLDEEDLIAVLVFTDGNNFQIPCQYSSLKTQIKVSMKGSLELDVS